MFATFMGQTIDAIISHVQPVAQYRLVFDARVAEMKRRRFGDFDRGNGCRPDLIQLLQCFHRARKTPASEPNSRISRFAMGLVSPRGLLAYRIISSNSSSVRVAADFSITLSRIRRRCPAISGFFGFDPVDPVDPAAGRGGVVMLF